MKRVIERFHAASGGYQRVVISRDPRNGHETTKTTYYRTLEEMQADKESE